MVAPTPIALSDQDRAQLESWVRSQTTEQRLAYRARVVLAAAAGEGSTTIAKREGVRLTTVSTWRVRFAKQGLAGLQELHRVGRPRTYGEEAERPSSPGQSAGCPRNAADGRSSCPS